MVKFWNLDLSEVDSLMKDRYSDFGPPPRLPSDMLRSILLSVKIKITSYTKWAANRSFSLVKRRYGLGRIMTKLNVTTGISIVLSILVMNVAQRLVASISDSAVFKVQSAGFSLKIIGWKYQWLKEQTLITY